MEEGTGLFKKLFPDKQILSLADDVMEGGIAAEALPRPFQKAVAVQINPVDRQKSSPADKDFNWYLLIESAECVLIRKGLRDWHLPCLYQGKADDINVQWN